MNPTDNPRDAVRAAYLPLDCPQATLQTLIQSAPERIVENPAGFEQYVQAALDTVTITPRAADGIEATREFLTFAALAPLRIRRANPLVDTAYEQREPAGSAERRMLHHPLLKHPGLTWFERNAREYYIATLTDFFEQTLPDGLQAEIAAVLLAPDHADPTTKTAYQTYADTDTETIHRRYADRVEITDTGDVRIATDHISRCCQLLPETASHIDYAYKDRFDDLQVTGGGLVIPQAQFRLHLAEYAWHAWAKLVNTAFNTVHPTDVARLVTATPRVDADIYGRFERNNTIYTPYYGTSGTENPKRDWELRTNQSLTNRPLQVEDKRLLTVVDCIRASPDLGFDLALPLDMLFDQIQAFFPAPHRPGNDIRTKTTLQNALEAATDTNIKLGQHPDVNGPVCVIPQPEQTPYHPTSPVAPWDCYRAGLAKQRHADPAQKPGTGPLTRQINPFLPHALTPKQATAYETHAARAQQTAVTTPRTVTSSHDVTPRTDPDSYPRLTHDELVFLTRISLAMERQLDDASLTRSMRPLRYDDTGTELNVNEAKLRNHGWLEHHEEGTGLLYTVPADKRRELGVTNISHDGYGEKTPAEKAVHRKGIDRCAAALAAKPDITRVIRYYDLWRLRGTRCEPALADNDLFSTRIDVIAFNDTTPKYAAGIETASGSDKKTQRCVQKLTALTDTLETWFVTPNSTHLWTVMRRANDPDCLDFTTFPDSSPDTYDRANWERELKSEGFLRNNFETLHTFRSLPNAKLNPDTDARRHKVVGHI